MITLTLQSYQISETVNSQAQRDSSMSRSTLSADISNSDIDDNDIDTVNLNNTTKELAAVTAHNQKVLER